MHGDLRVPTDVALGESDDPVRTRFSGESRSFEQELDTLPCIAGRGRKLESHQPALVESPLDETGLLEHSDENPRIAVRSGRGELRRIDGSRAVAESAIHGSELLSRGDVRDGEPSKRDGVAAACQQKRVARRSVASCSADLLHVALQRVREVDQADEPYVSLVDAHPEGGGRDDRLHPPGDELVLHACTVLGLHPCVVVLRANAVTAQNS